MASWLPKQLGETAFQESTSYANKMFMVTIISKKFWSLKAANGQPVEGTDYANIKIYEKELFLQWSFPCA